MALTAVAVVLTVVSAAATRLASEATRAQAVWVEKERCMLLTWVCLGSQLETLKKETRYYGLCKVGTEVLRR
jgi:hypothetical protein